MAKLELKTICAISETYGSIEFLVNDVPLELQLSTAEIAELRAIAFRSYDRQRAELADSIRTAQPPALTHIPEADFDEVPF